jgi:signal transduction histidine kinase
MENEVAQTLHAAVDLPWSADPVIHTHLLQQRPSKAPNYQAENAAMMELMGELANDPESVTQRLVEVALRLTAAGSAGLSLAETEDGKEIFRWIATAGQYARYLHGTMPRDFSPCGEVLRRGEPLLMRDVVRAYPYTASLHAPPTEVLLVPFANNGKLVGTVWIVAHDPGHTFDKEDLRVVASLAVFASAVSATVSVVRNLAARESERDQNAQAISRELQDTRLLRDVASRLIGTEGSDALFGEILDAAINITQADAGTIQLHNKDSNTLTFLATRGFAPDILTHFARVDASSGSPCGIALSTGKRAMVEFRRDAPDPDGSIKLHADAGFSSAQSTPLISRTGQPMGMFSTHWHAPRELSERELRFLDLLGRQAADLIERIEVQEALRSSEKALREGARRKDEFLAVLAHELRNPLAPIRTGTDLLKRAMHEPIVAKVQPMMERQTTHMVRLIDDLLDVSRITSGKVVLQHETVTLGSLVETAVEANRSALVAAGLELQVEMDEPERRLDVDATRMSQVLSNILHNAVKFTPAGGKIILSTRLDPGPSPSQVEQVIAITDTGVGIAADTLPTIFELFTQARPDSALRHGGMGIGLALARSLVSLHGGTLSAESQGPGTGSTFVIRIPAPALASLAAPQSIPSAAAKLAGLRVLVVDDNRDAAEALGHLLSHHGSDVRISYLAEPAIDLLGEFDPAIVLLDIGLPFMDGYEACKRMRAMKGTGVRIVALTGWGQDSDRHRAAEAGFDAHLTKPVEFERLAAVAFPGD